MTFGLMGASSTFQRMMDDLLSDLNSSSAAYIDDSKSTLMIGVSTWSTSEQNSSCEA